jgi:7-cyano-7-deazaguanine synthase
MRTAVLLSAGLDSAVLAAAEARHAEVQPVYVSAGLAWEAEEIAAVGRLLATARYRSLSPLTVLTFTVRDLYPATHWALRGEPPAFDTPDEDVYLAGRNIILLSKAGIYCAQQKIPRLAIGPLAGNPFPDATPEFFAAMARALSLGLDQSIEIAAPFADKEKSDVIRLGAELGVPLELTLSCMNPRQGRHCGQCSKCRERRDAFHLAGFADPTVYAVMPVR